MTRTELEELKYIIRKGKELISIEKQGYALNRIGDGVYEFVKTDTGHPLGDYLNPIYWDGQSVERGLFYYTEDKDLPAEAKLSGIPTGWNKDWFDIIG